jgi:hypothetical protein
MDPYRRAQDNGQDDSQNDPAQIKQKFRRTLTLQVALSFGMLGAICVFLLIQRQWGDLSFVPLIAIGAVTLVAIIVSLFNWRCPACRRYLGRSLWPAYCSRCGVRLR